MGIKILYVEDELFLGKIVKESLESRGYEIFMEEDGANAMALFQSCSPDICVLDVMLPNKDGWEVVEDLRRDGMRTPILFLTARDSVRDRVKGLEIGADDYLVKPFAFS